MRSLANIASIGASVVSPVAFPVLTLLAWRRMRSVVIGSTGSGIGGNGVSSLISSSSVAAYSCLANPYQSVSASCMLQ